MKLSDLGEQLKQDLSIIEFLNIIKQANNDLMSRGGYIIVSKSMIAHMSRSTSDTINYCSNHGLIDVVPLGRKSYEYYLTDKGLGFLKSSNAQI